MSRLEKLKTRLQSRPTDFTWDEAESLLKKLGYTIISNRGSRYKFVLYDGDGNKTDFINLHKPHPQNTLKTYMVNDLIDHLKAIGKIT